MRFIVAFYQMGYARDSLRCIGRVNFENRQEAEVIFQAAAARVSQGTVVELEVQLHTADGKPVRFPLHELESLLGVSAQQAA